MTWLLEHQLTLLTFLPLAGVVALVAFPRAAARQIRWAALIVSLLELLLAARAFSAFDLDKPGMQFVKDIAWISSPPIRYHVGVDGLSLLLILLSAFLTPLAVLASWTGVIQRVKEFHLFLLALESGVVGVFVSLDLFLFFIFWEVMLIPMYFLIGVWGHERRVYAAVKFILYTMIGSALMLVGILYLYSVPGVGVFDYPEIARLLSTGAVALSGREETWLFLAFFLAFAIKVPLFPLHTWLPDAHTEAPTAGSVILAGVLLKMGTYGMLRFCLPFFPHASRQFAPLISVLALIGIIYGALVAMVQPDLKRLVAYSSVAHLGFVVLGIFAFNLIALQGAVYQMLSHGVSTGALFILVGMLYDRRHTRLIKDFGGLGATVPVLTTFFVLVALSSLGLPMLNGFVGELLIILGAFQRSVAYGAVAAMGVVLSAVYLLWMVQRVFLGEVTNEDNRTIPDCNRREKFMLAVVALVILAMGIYPQPFFRRMDWSASNVLRRFETSGTRLALKQPPRPPGGGR